MGCPRKATHLKGYFHSNYWKSIQFKKIVFSFYFPNPQLFRVSYHCWTVIIQNTTGNVIIINLWAKLFILQSHHYINFVYISSHLHRCWWSCIFASLSFAIFLLHSAGPPVNVTCNIFINSFGSVTETTMVSATMRLARAKHDLIMSWTQPVKFSIYCSTCRASCKCYLQHIYQQFWVNSRNYNGEWDWALKPWCKGMGHGIKEHHCGFVGHLLGANVEVHSHLESNYSH